MLLLLLLLRTPYKHRHHQSSLNQSLASHVASLITQKIQCTMKFGGSSLANYERVDHVANLIKDQIAGGTQPRAVVCSAMGKTTNSLLSAGEFALGECLRNACVRVACVLAFPE